MGQVTLVGGVLFYERDLWWVALPSALGFGVVLARARGGALASLPAGRALSLGFAMAVALVGLVGMQFADARWSLNGVRVLLVGAAAVSVLVGLAYLAGAGISGLRERKLVRSAATIQWLAYGGACSTSYVFTLHRGGYLFASLLLLYLGLLVVLIVVDTDWCLRRPGRWLLLTGAPVIFACGAVTLHLPRQDLETRFGPYSTDSLIGLAAYLVSVPQDSDRDGYYLQRVGGNDCNDAEPMTHPGGKEPCEARSYDAKAHFSESRAIANLIVFVFDAVRGTELSRPENLRRYPFCTA